MSKAKVKRGATGGRCVDVYVKLSSGRNVQYDVTPSTPISEVIALAAGDESVKPNQVNLKYQGKVLDGSKTVDWYGVRPETILKTEILTPKSLTLIIFMTDDTSEQITMSNLDSTGSLYDAVADKSEIRSDLLELKHNKKKISTGRRTKLMDIGIEDRSEIHVTVKEEKAEAEAEAEAKESGAAPVVQANDMDDDEKEAVLSSFQSGGRQVEVVFSFDTTGSMYQYLAEVRSKLRNCCTRLLRDIPTIRIGIMAHGDYCDQATYVIRFVDLTSDVDALVTFAQDVPSTSGGDCPECYEWVLRKAQHLDWSENSAKALVVIGDEIPHPPSYTDQNIRWRDELDVLKGMGVKVYGVQPGNIAAAAKFYAEIAEQTEGRYLKLNNFDVITDMFLAVCYREGNEEMLEDLQQEIQGAGRMTEQAQAMFEELKETDEEKQKKKEEREKKASTSQPEEEQRYVRAEWWDHTLPKEHKNPNYTYDAENDIWNSFTTFREPDLSHSAGATESSRSDSGGSRLRRSIRRIKGSKAGKKCSIM